MTDTPIIKSKRESNIKIGDPFGRLEVIGEAIRIKNHTYYSCKCICGTIKLIRGDAISSGITKSCGCLCREVASKRLKKENTTHGMRHTDTYRSWANMIQRCNNPNNSRFIDYGGRGITICERWLNFENFYMDMGEMPEGLTIERVDNDKGYHKDNCFWDSRIGQARNRRVGKNNKTGVSGISFETTTKQYHVEITENSKVHFLGRYTDINKATSVRKKAEQKYWGKKYDKPL